MSPISFALDLVLISLLLSALVFGIRLNRRLKALRDTQAGFAQAALSLDAAIHHAEAGLAEMRRTTHDAELSLTELVDEARAAARKLEEALARVRSSPPPAPAEVQVAAETREVFAPPRLRAVGERDDVREPLRRTASAHVAAGVTTAEASPRSRARIDDDLFDDGFQEMRLRAGAGR